jgi:hypothetical protein
MPFSDASYDPETLSLLDRAFKEAWQEVEVAIPSAANNGSMETTRKMMALRIMDAANQGERDKDRLKRLAVQAVDGRDFG